MKIYFVYIIYCSDESYYIGVTNNIRRRFQEHRSGYNPTSYTAQRLPLKLVYYEVFKNVIEAIQREKQLKGWSRIKKEALIENRPNRLKILSKKKFRERRPSIQQ